MPTYIEHDDIMVADVAVASASVAISEVIAKQNMVPEGDANLAFIMQPSCAAYLTPQLCDISSCSIFGQALNFRWLSTLAAIPSMCYSSSLKYIQLK